MASATREQRVALHGVALEQDLARSRLEQPGDHLHGGGFARAVGPEVTRDFAGTRGEADVVHGGDAGETLGNLAKFEHKPRRPATGQTPVTGSRFPRNLRAATKPASKPSSA